MTEEQIALVQQSFAGVVPITDDAAAIFYDRLFTIAPQTRPLFRGDMRDQGRKLMGTLATVVNGLHTIDTVLPVARALARRHVRYGVKAEHYAPVGEALIDTLRVGLGAGFDRRTEDAWRAAYGTLSAVMIEAADAGQTSTAA